MERAMGKLLGHVGLEPDDEGIELIASVAFRAADEIIRALVAFRPASDHERVLRETARMLGAYLSQRSSAA
jgi:hypothetical protein